MMKHLSTLLLVCTLSLFFNPSFASSTIISTNSFSTIQAMLKQAKKPTHILLALDNDDTLTMMPCPSPTHCQYLGGPAWFNWQSKLPKNSPDRIWKTFPQLLKINNFLFVSSHMVLDDPAIPDTLKTAGTLGVHTIVITDRGYSMIDATQQQFISDNILSVIEKNAIKTSADQVSFPAFYFPTQWRKKDAPRRIAYENGVLYDSGQNKGVMLKQFLNKTNETKNIHTIIFVDDAMKNIKAVAAAYKNDPAVHVIAIHFTRLAAHKAAFLTGKDAKKWQAAANQQWYSIRNVMKKNMLGFAL